LEKNKAMNRTFTILTIFTFLLAACNAERNAGPAGPGGWLQGDEQEKFNTVARQLRGFDMAMLETGYRYTELYFTKAGQKLQKESEKEKGQCPLLEGA
jgi:hypothetical protein